MISTLDLEQIRGAIEAHKQGHDLPYVANAPYWLMRLLDALEEARDALEEARDALEEARDALNESLAEKRELNTDNDNLRRLLQEARKDQEQMKAQIAEPDKFTYCAYCGHMIKTDQDASLIGEHIRECPNHPIAEYRAEIARLRAIVERERWVCDETTPETSRPVLLRIERRNGKRNTIQAEWVARYTEEACEDYDEEDCDYNPDDDVHYIPEGWYEYVEYGDLSNRVSDRVIGWRHMPAGPEVTCE